MKTLFKGIVLLLIIAVAGGYFFANTLLGKVMEQAIGAPVRVGRVHLGLFSSEVGIYGLRVENPEGFRERTLASVPEIFVQYDLPSFFTGKPHIRLVRVNVEEITVEKNPSGTVNLLELKALKGPGAKPASGAEPPPPEVQIDQVVLNLGEARYVDYAAGSPVTRQFNLGVQNEVLHNVTQPQQVTKDIVVITLKKVGLAALTSGIDTLAKGWQTQITDSFEKLRQKLNL